MISEIRIQNFKSIEDLTLKPGRVTVLIGANGSGKSNILEGIAFAAGASEDKLDSTFLFSRGIRESEDTWMRSAFSTDLEIPVIPGFSRPISLSLKGDDSLDVNCEVFAIRRPDDKSFLGWGVSAGVSETEMEQAVPEALRAEVTKGIEERAARIAQSAHPDLIPPETWVKMMEWIYTNLAISRRKTPHLAASAKSLGLTDFMIYSPENTVLRTPPPEGAVLPLGSRGEGLFKLLQSFVDPKIDPELTSRFQELKVRLHLFGWFEDLLAPDDSATAQARLQLRDRYLAEDRAIFDQRSANEGFLYVLFYFTLLMSWRTPKFFAIDNLDNALNPKLCAVLMKQIVELAEKYGKQVICTTHNPAVLEGLDLTDDKQRLFVVRRNVEGRTAVRRIHPPQPQPGEPPVPLSDAFMRGLIGGLPENF